MRFQSRCRHSVTERAEKLLSFLQVRVLPQESIRCLRSYGVHVEGNLCVGATPDKCGLGEVTYAETFQTPSGHTFSNTFTIEASNVVADQSQCRLSYHLKRANISSSQVVADEDQGFSLRDFQDVVVRPLAQYLTEQNAIHGPKLAVPSTNPPLSALVLHPADGKDRFFLFADDTLADRVDKAITHAVTLCGSNKEPF